MLANILLFYIPKSNTMKRFFLLAALSMITINLLSCAESRKMAKSEEENAESFIQKQGEASVFATISKSPCYGKCPVYKMTIYSDGRAVLEGQSNIEFIGTYETTLSKEELQAFIDTAKSIDYFGLEDKYDSPITDIPSTTTSIVIDGKKKEVYRRADYPQKILTFEKLFTELLGNKKWKKTEAEN